VCGQTMAQRTAAAGADRDLMGLTRRRAEAQTARDQRGQAVRVVVVRAVEGDAGPPGRRGARGDESDDQLSVLPTPAGGPRRSPGHGRGLL